MKVGDFLIAEISKTFAQDTHEERSERARDVDEQNRAPVTTGVQAWSNNPDQLDFPGVDTPGDAPGVLPKDLMDPAPTKTSADARDESPVEPLSSEERDEVSELARLSGADVSLSPDEALYGVATGAQQPGNIRAMEQGLAYGREADIAFDAAERERL